jgi:hypothetical protein
MRIWIVNGLGLFKFQPIIEYTIKGVLLEIFLIEFDKYFEVV